MENRSTFSPAYVILHQALPTFPCSSGRKKGKDIYHYAWILQMNKTIKKKKADKKFQLLCGLEHNNYKHAAPRNVSLWALVKAEPRKKNKSNDYFQGSRAAGLCYRLLESADYSYDWTHSTLSAQRDQAGKCLCEGVSVLKITEL